MGARYAQHGQTRALDGEDFGCGDAALSIRTAPKGIDMTDATQRSFERVLPLRSRAPLSSEVSVKYAALLLVDEPSMVQVVHADVLRCLPSPALHDIRQNLQYLDGVEGAKAATAMYSSAKAASRLCSSKRSCLGTWSCAVRCR